MMKKIFIFWLMSILLTTTTLGGFSALNIGNDYPCLDGAGPLLPGQDRCESTAKSLFNFIGDVHYEIEYQSVFTHYYNVENSNTDPQTLYIDFGFDVNNFNPSRPIDDYRIYERYNFYNFIRASSSKEKIDNYMEQRVSSYEVNKHDTDFIGIPLSIDSCFLDCDFMDNIPAQVWDLRDGMSNWYQYIVGGDVPADWLNNRLDISRQFKDSYKTYRFENNFYQCSYTDPGLKQVVLGCTFKIDDYLRQPNIDYTFDFWGINDILPSSFSDAPDDAKYWTMRKRININVGEDNYTVTNIEDDEIFQTNGLSATNTNSVSEKRQENTYLLLANAQLQGEWQKTLIFVIKNIFTIVLIIFYLFSTFILMFFFFGSFPYIFRKFVDKLDELSTLKIKRRYK